MVTTNLSTLVVQKFAGGSLFCSFYPVIIKAYILKTSELKVKKVQVKLHTNSDRVQTLRATMYLVLFSRAR